MKWVPFLKEELISVIKKCSNTLTLRLDKLSWRHLKRIVKDDVCIDIGHWPSHFKVLTTIIISKPNKESYDSSKAYHSIVFLNIIGKLFEKVISKKLQFLLISNKFIHLC